MASCSLVGDHVLALVGELVVRIVGVVEDVEVPGVQEIAVGGVAEVNDSAFLSLVVYIEDLDTLVTVIASPHPAHPIEGHIAVGCGLGLMIPVRARISVIAEVRGEPIGFLWG